MVSVNNQEYLGLLIKMQNNGASQYTIINTDKALSFLSRNCNLQDPKNVNEATTLIESGFEYVTDIDELRLFKKRKQ